MQDWSWRVTDSTRAAAQNYLKRGWSIIPIRPREKRPIISWQRFQQRMPTESDVDVWFDRWPSANIAIVTGALSGLIVVDVDPAHGGRESLDDLQRTHGPLRDTLEARSGGGGRHLYFAHPGGTVHNRVDLAPGIDLRGDGGLIVAPPSVHPSGNRYAWIPGHGPGEIELAQPPTWLLERLDKRRGHSVAYWRELVGTGVVEGSRNATLASLTGHLLWHGVDTGVITELLLCWNRVRCRPPLSDAEVVRTVASVNRSHRRAAPTDSPD